MVALVPEVHIFICLDTRISPGPLLHCLDLARAQDWTQETVLICDESWRSFVTIDQPVLFIDKSKVFNSENSNANDKGAPYLDKFLEQLDNFEVKKITQVGDLSWGRWLQAYFDSEAAVEIQNIQWSDSSISSLELINDISEELALDVTLPIVEGARASSVYIDPYTDDQLAPAFIELINGLGKTQVPPWLQVVVRDGDRKKIKSLNMEDSLIDLSEVEISLFNQSVLCFSDQSVFAQTSRSYNVALFNCGTSSSLFVPGDIEIDTETAIHVSELFNILSYWKMKRLKELSFQWLNMGIDIHHVECFHSRVVKRNLLNYSSDLFHCQIITQNFLKSDGRIKSSSIRDTIHFMRREINNDPYALSFSLKIILMIVERMIASANCGERLFQRLGSDYHRMIVGEALIEGLITQSEVRPEPIDIKEKLNQFHKYLLKIDHINDHSDSVSQNKDSL